ncbi:hypothetical protein BV20DRAFT_352972 [Pilatotrama ljubarskyi]|nr:hypothetical protein BV20DRAFT_352972 [Pilatotrama ljubarskyi]
MLAELGPEDGHVPRNIMVALCATEDSGSYHWLIYLCMSNRRGYKFHAHNDNGKSYWRYEYKAWNGMDSASCVAFTKIGRLADDLTPDDIDEAVKTIPMAVPDRDRPRFGDRFTCLVWLRAAMYNLHVAGIIRVTDIDELETKLRQRTTAIQYRREMGLQELVPVILTPSEYTY